MKPLNHLDIVLSVYNQENLIERVLYGIFRNTSTSFNLIVVFDGCTDRTEKRALRYIRKFSPKSLRDLKILHAPNVYETKANNIGFRAVNSEFMITLQDDMVIREFGWERRLTYPLRKFEDILAVTSRCAQDIDKIDNINQYYTNRAAREFGTLSRETFAVRDVINRGPVAFNMRHLKNLNYLDESYAPSDLDDADLSLRAWCNHRLRVGAYWIDYLSPSHWGKARSPDSNMYENEHISKNGIKLFETHKEYLSKGEKHTEDIKIEESEVDFEPKTTAYYLYPLFRPYRIHKKGLLHGINQSKESTKTFIFKILELAGIKDARERGIKKILKISK